MPLFDRVVRDLLPWEFYPTVAIACLAAIGLYLRGLARHRASGGGALAGRPASFFTGVGLIYLAMQTRFDFLSQHMFWIHRLQHLVLHHVAPFLIALSQPFGILGLALPASWVNRPHRPRWWHRTAWIAYAALQNPVVAPTLFVGLIYFWLTPSIHFGAMLNDTRYQIMNGSMVIDGLLFWWLILSPRDPARHANYSYGTRLLMLFAVMVPQIYLGAHITFHGAPLYDVYNLCGRVWPIDPLFDQELGGLITWIPPSMMSVLGILIVLHRWMHDDTAPAPHSAPSVPGAR